MLSPLIYQVKGALAAFIRGISLTGNTYDLCRYHKDTHEIVAIKVIDLDYAEDDVDDIMKEIAILAQLNSKYVTRLRYTSLTLMRDTLDHISKARIFGL